MTNIDLYEPASYENDKGHILHIQYDDTHESPRKWDPLGTMLTWESGHSSPDVNEFQDLEEWLMSHCPENSKHYCQYGGIANKEHHEALEKYLDKHYVWSRVNVYNHSGVIYSTGSFICPWDSGQCGYIFVEKEKIRKEHNVKRISKTLKKSIHEIFEVECENYTKYVNGEVYGFTIEDSKGDTLESCWGYFNISDIVEELTNQKEWRL